jgi:hypothetical protein
MTPRKPALVDLLESAGLTISLTESMGLKVIPASALTSAMREEIKVNKAALVDWLLAMLPPEPFVEPPGYEGTGWRLAGAEGLTKETLDRFHEASQVLDRLKIH